VYRASAAAQGGDTSTEGYYRVNVYYPTLDAVIQDIHLRFGNMQQKAVGLSCIIPAKMTFTNDADSDNDNDWRQLSGAIDVYAGIFCEPPVALKQEYLLWRRKWQTSAVDSRPKTALSSLDQCSELLFPNIALLLQILATFPIATVEAERMFSKVEQTLTAIRSTMHESRLEALLLLQQHRTLTPSVAAVIDRFALTAARRLKFLL